MKRLFSLLLLSLLLSLLLPLWCMGATYYASPTGSGTTCSEASPCAAVYTIATKASSGDTVYLRGGSYTGLGQIVFAKKLTIMSYPGEHAILNFGENHGIYFEDNRANGSVLSDFTIGTGGGATSVAIYDYGADIAVSDVTIDGWTGRPIYARNGATSTFNRVLANNCGGSTVLADATTVWNYSQWIDCGSGTDPAIQSTSATGNHTINNGLILGGASSPTGLSVMNGTVVLNNTPVLPGKLTTTNVYTVARSGGSLTLNNSPVNGNLWRAGSYGISGTVTQNNSTNNVNPMFRGRNNAILTLFAVDSSHSTDGTGPSGVGTSLGHYTTEVAKYGAHISYFPDDTDHLTEAQKAVILAAATGGHDVGAEGLSSTGLSQTNPFKVTYSGAGANPRYIVTYTSDTNAAFALVTDSGTDATFEIGKGQTYQYIGGALTAANSLVKAIHDLADWTVTLNYAAGEFDDAYAYCLTAGTVAVSGATDVNLDTDKWYPVEVTQTMSDIATVTGVPVTSYMFSRYLYAADARALAKAAGATVAVSASMGVVQLSSITDIYQINNPHIYYVAYLKGDGSEAQVRANVRSLAEAMTRYGLWVSIVLEEAAAITADEIKWIITEMQAAGVMVKSFREARAWLDANCTATDDAFACAAVTQDFRLLPRSGWINAGTDVGLTTDYLGKPVRGTPDIGAYEFQPVGSGLFLGLGIGF